MKDQKDKRCRFISYSQFWSYLPGVPLILSMTVILLMLQLKYYRYCSFYIMLWCVSLSYFYTVVVF